MIYTPEFFKVEDATHAFRLIDAHDFATLISSPNGDLVLSHLPLMPEMRSGQLVLVGHMARANPHWREFSDKKVTALFHGPHAYVSPAWYVPSPRNVPTWNYAVVHTSGRARILGGDEAISTMQKLVNRYETRFQSGWSLENPMPKEAAALMGSIVVFEIDVEKLEAKFKLSQQQPPVNRDRVIEELEKIPSDDCKAVAQLMREYPSKYKAK